MSRRLATGLSATTVASHRPDRAFRVMKAESRATVDSTGGAPDAWR